MAIIRVNPYGYMNRYWGPLADGDWDLNTDFDRGLNVYEQDGSVVVEAAMPGIPEDKIDITLEDGVLHIQGKIEKTEEEKKKNVIVHKMEMTSSYHFSTYLPRPVDQNKMEAHLKDGVLTVRAPIAESAKAKKITVKASK